MLHTTHCIMYKVCHKTNKMIIIVYFVHTFILNVSFKIHRDKILDFGQVWGAIAVIKQWLPTNITVNIY